MSSVRRRVAVHSLWTVATPEVRVRRGYCCGSGPIDAVGLSCGQTRLGVEERCDQCSHRNSRVLHPLLTTRYYKFAQPLSYSNNDRASIVVFRPGCVAGCLLMRQPRRYGEPVNLKAVRLFAEGEYFDGRDYR